ncbi:MAG: hypothetical protein U0350_42805 [Caldilineaceae bacterium]
MAGRCLASDAGTLSPPTSNTSPWPLTCASSWDIWGGDQLQVDLIDPVTNQSILATPVQWTTRQLANGGWIPLRDLQDWPGIDTPLELVFRAQTDWAFPTNFTLDNIRFLTACH